VAEVKKAGDARIFSFGIGSDVNTQLLDQIAEGNACLQQYVLANEDLEEKFRVSIPGSKNRVLTNVRFEFGGGNPHQ